jgi:hypothetical protein
LAGLIHPEWRGESTCEACGAAFVCGATLAGCWCTEIKLTDTTRADLRGKYERCLCRACLEGLADAETNAEASAETRTK